MRWHTLILAVLLAGCASQQAQDVRAWAVGRSIAELEQCAGRPTSTDDLPDGSHIAQWDYTEPNGSTSVPLPFAAVADAVDLLAAPIAFLAPLATAGSASVSFASSGSCHAIATLREGRVTQLRYSGPNGGVSGPDSVCAPIMRECLRR